METEMDSSMELDMVSSGEVEEDLILKVQFASSQWDEAPKELIELRSKLRFLGDRLNLKPMEFGATLLTANETRENILLEVLKKIFADEKFFCSSSFEETLTKTAWACRHLGIEKNADVVHGKCSMEQNLTFWRKITNAMPDLTAGPVETKILMETTISQGEAKLTWMEFIESVTQRLMANQLGKSDVPQITLDEVGNLEKLHLNGMTSHEKMEKLKNGVDILMKNLALPNQCLDAVSNQNLKDVRDQGEELLGLLVDFLDFMKTNDNFNSKKMEFLICHSEMIYKSMTEILQLHRNFLRGVTQSLGESVYQ